jgi:hypothetical protein
MIKKIIITFISIVMMGLILLNGFTRVYDLVKYKHITRFIPVIVVLLLLIGVIIFLVKKKATMISLALLSLILLIMSNVISTQIINYEYGKVFKCGERIGIALDQYYKDNQHYPQDVAELIPKYIDSIPEANTLWNKADSNSSFSYYAIDEGNDYVLSYESYTYDGKGWYQEP